MAVTDEYLPVREAGNGVKVAFDATWPIIQASDLNVGKVLNSTNVKTTMVLGVDYTVSINPVNKRPTVTYTVAPTTLQDSWIGRAVPITQTAVIPTNSVFRESQLNTALDRAIMICQQLKEEIDRCVKSDEVLVGVSLVFPAPQDGYAIAWDGVSGTMQNVLIDTDVILAAVAAAEAAQAAAEVAEDGAGTARTAAQAAQAAAEAALAAMATLASQAEAEAGTENAKWMSPLRVAQAIAALTGLNVKVGSLTRNLATASGSQVITGMGFIPTAVAIFGSNGGTETMCQGVMSASAQGCVSMTNATETTSAFTDRVINIDNGGADLSQADYASFDSDGFTLTWTKGGAHTGTYTGIYLAIG
jgi:hypothetical protein